MIVLSTIGSISLGWALVAGRKRVPSPAAGKTALRTLELISYSFYRLPVGCSEPRSIDLIESFDWIAWVPGFTLVHALGGPLRQLRCFPAASREPDRQLGSVHG